MAIPPLVGMAGQFKSKQTPISYLSLSDGLADIVSTLTGVSGVYMLFNSEDPSRSYIGSTVNLGRRMTEYCDLTKGLRASGSGSEREIALTPPQGWSVIILDIDLPANVRLLEQLAMYLFRPTINQNYVVNPLVDPKWDNPQSAITLAAELMTMFVPGSIEHTQFANMLARYTLASSDNISMNPEEQSIIGRPVWVYPFVGATPIIYSSINYAMTVLQISYGTLMSRVKFNHLHGLSYLILSLNPLTPEEQAVYSLPFTIGNSFQLLIDVFDSLGNLVHTADSARNLCKWWALNVGPVDAKTLRPYINNNGTYKGYTFSTTPVPRGQTIYRWDAVTLTPMSKLNSLTAAFSLVNMKWYNFIAKVDSQTPINGVIYSWSPDLKVKNNK